MMSEEIQANKAIMEEADMFFTALEFNKGKVALLGNVYDALDNNLGSIEMEVKEKLEEIRKINEEIAKLMKLIAPLQAKKSELMKSIESKEREKDLVSYGHSIVANSMTNMFFFLSCQIFFLSHCPF